MQHLDTLWIQMTMECFGKTMQQMPRSTMFKKVSVVLHGLQQNGAITGDLFHEESGDARKTREKRESLSCAIAALNKKYHRDAISLGVTPKTLAGHIGTKIAFSRIPDLEEFED